MPDELMQQMRGVAEYREMVKVLRAGAVGALIFGGLAVWGGAVAVVETPVALVPLIFGVLLLADAVQALVAPSPPGMMLHGMCFLLIGAWNILSSLLWFVPAGPQCEEFALILGMTQIAWGISYSWRYPLFARRAAGKPHEDVLRALSEIACEIAKASPPENEDIIELQTKSFRGETKLRARLADTAATFVAVNGHHMILAAPDELIIESTGKVLGSKTLRSS